MKDLLTGKSMLFIELQNSAAFKSYSTLKFGRVSYKKGWIIWIFRYFTFFELLLHLSTILLKFGTHICRQKIQGSFFQKYHQLLMLYQLCTKQKTQKIILFHYFLCKFSKKSKIDNIFEKILWFFCLYM